MKNQEAIEAEDREAARVMDIYASAWPQDLKEYGTEGMYQDEVIGESVLYAMDHKMSDAAIVEMAAEDAAIRRSELDELANRSDLEDQISMYQDENQCEYLKNKIWEAWQSEYPEILKDADREYDQEIISKIEQQEDLLSPEMSIEPVSREAEKKSSVKMKM